MSQKDDMNTYELHPLCTLFPRLGDSEFSSLVEDIRANGLREPITVHDGMILDGGNRYRACLEAGIEPSFKAYSGSSIVAYVLSANLHRRHLSAGQQAAIVASAQDWAKAQTVGNPSLKSQSGNVTGLATVEDRMAQSGASDKTQRMADKVAKADPELAKQVAHGEVSLPKAVAQVEGKTQAKPPKLEVVSDELAELRAENARLKEWGEENAATAKELLAENESMAKILDQNDQVAAALAEVKKYREINRILEERIRGLMGEKNEAIRSAKSWQRKAQALGVAA